MFRIKSYIELAGWHPIEMTMPLVKQEHCPCGGALETACALVGTGRVDVGVCKDCGYLGYIDRPDEQWFEDYYRDDWDQESLHDLQHKIERLRSEQCRITPCAVMALAARPSSKDTILEVGCGYGLSLLNLWNAEYKNLMGVEPSRHRVEIAKEAFGMDIRHGKFGDVKERFSFIYSHHVLEHCYDPAAFIAHAASIQQDGDRLVFAVPSQEFEPTMGILLFLPHLHSFTPLTITKMLVNHGYSVESAIFNLRTGLEFVGRKGGEMQLDSAGDCSLRSIAKLRKALHWGEPVKDVLWWDSVGDRTGWEATGGLRSRCAAVESCEQVTDAPCEVQFEGHLRLCVK